MKENMSIRDAARLWKIGERRVSTLCRNGKIDGAFKKGRAWLIPVDAKNLLMEG